MFKSKEKFVNDFKVFLFSNRLWKLSCGMWKKLLKSAVLDIGDYIGDGSFEGGVFAHFILYLSDIVKDS